VGVDGLPEELANGLGFQLDVDAARPLAELTASVAALCDRVEDHVDSTVAVLRLGTLPARTRSWPGPVSLREVSRWERGVRRLERLPAMNIAVAQGVCGGPALDLLLATDFRICAPDLKLLLPVNNGQFWPGMSIYWLVQQLGLARARQLVLWGDTLSADRALDIGLVDQIAENLAGFEHTAIAMMGRISNTELAVRRQLLFDAATSSFEDALGAHLAACDRELRRLREQPESARRAAVARPPR
jgi:isomerase DpgB